VNLAGVHARCSGAQKGTADPDRGIFYITDPTKWPLQVLLRSVVVMADLNQLGGSNRDMYGALTLVAGWVPPSGGLA